MAAKLPRCSMCFYNIDFLEDGFPLPCRHMFHFGCSATYLSLYHACPICHLNVDFLEVKKRYSYSYEYLTPEQKEMPYLTPPTVTEVSVEDLQKQLEAASLKREKGAEDDGTDTLKPKSKNACLDEGQQNITEPMDELEDFNRLIEKRKMLINALFRKAEQKYEDKLAQTSKNKKL